MPIEKVRLLSLMVLGSSYITWFFGDYGPIFFALELLILIPLWLPINLDRIRPLAIWKLLGLAALVFFGVSSYVSTWEVGIFVLVLFCLIYEFYGETREGAPLRLISLVSFLIIVYMGNVDTGLTLLIGLLLYIATVVFCLMAFYLGAAHEYRIGAIVRCHFATLLRGIVFALSLGIVFFWCLPRSESQSLATLPTIGGNHISGFSDRVSLNDIGSLKLSRKHVMDLKPLDGILHSNYLKGRVMDYYQNGMWSTVRQSNWLHQSPELVFDFWKRPQQAGVFSYTIELEPMFGNNLFFFDTLLSLEGRLHPLKIEGPLNNLSVIRNKPLSITYTITAADMPGPNRIDFDQSPYLVTPPDHEYLGELAQAALGEYLDASVAERVRYLKKFFLENFKYSLDIENSGKDDPLKFFLEEARAGHCELFASSMVLMLRSQGIPARLVTGFLVPEPHPSGEFYYITEADAHAWVEYEDNQQWHTIDPTPPANFSQPSFFESSLALMERWWRNQVVTFDFETQQTFFTRVRANTATVVAYFIEHPWFAGLILAVLAVPLAFFGLIPMPRFRQDRVIRGYMRLERRLNREDNPRGIHEGICDYVKRLNLGGGLELDLLLYFRNYHRYRFGRDQQMPTGELVRLGRTLVRRLAD